MKAFVQSLNARLAGINPEFSARFVSAGFDESVGDEIQILRAGKETGLTIQFGDSYVGVSFWDDADQSSLDLFHGGRLSHAKAAQAALDWCAAAAKA